MATTVGKLATAQGRTKDEVLAACRAIGVVAWSEHTPLDDGETQRVLGVLQAGPPAPGPGRPGLPPPPGGSGPGLPPPPLYGAGYGPSPMAPAPRRGLPMWARLLAGGVMALVGWGVGSALIGGDDHGSTPDAGSEAPLALPDERGGGELVVGDCWNDHSQLAGSNGEAVEADLVELPCTEPHDAEVFSVGAFPAAPDDPFPGADVVSLTAQQQCTDQFGTFVGVPFDQSTLDLIFVYPTELSWEAADDRAIICSVTDYADDGVTYLPIVGSMAGAAR